MRFSILGESATIKDDLGRDVLPETRRRQHLVRSLVCVLAYQDWALSARQLKPLIWRDADSRNLTSNLTSLIYDARRLIPRDRLISTLGRDGTTRYHLDRRAGDEVDVELFRAAFTLGRQARDAGDLHTAASSYSRALLLWSSDEAGVSLGDFPKTPIMLKNRENLLSQRRQASEAYIEVRLALGHHIADLADEIHGLIQTQQTNTRLHHLRILSLYRAGRRGEALLAYEDAVKMFERLPPTSLGHDLDRLRERIVNDDPRLLHEG
ncbi:AfsR/SARP family transcriptional regulator [Actinomadura rubrisoli]|nr:BTAD domain-containing putative transcriptional regulator [Actinomadura rubrisoli]